MAEPLDTTAAQALNAHLDRQISLARIPGGYIADAAKPLGHPAPIGAEPRYGYAEVGEPWNFGWIRLRFEVHVPRTAGAVPFWKPVSAERVDGPPAPA